LKVSAAREAHGQNREGCSNLWEKQDTKARQDGGSLSGVDGEVEVENIDSPVEKKIKK